MDTFEAGATVVPVGPELRQVAPRSILPSPFGEEVNLPASEAEEEALEQSIAEYGIQNPIICKEQDDSQLRCLAGTRRLRFATKLGLAVVPVLIAKFDSEEAERQFAIKDNAERRHLSSVGKAKLGLLLWNSLKKSSKEKGRTGDSTARNKAAIAASISAGTLFNYKFVLDYGDPETIEAMQSEKIAIGAAYAKTKAQIDGEKKETAITRSVRANKVLEALKGQMVVLKALPRLAEQIGNLSKASAKCKAADREKLRKRLDGAREVLLSLKNDEVIDKILDAISGMDAELAQ